MSEQNQSQISSAAERVGIAQAALSAYEAIDQSDLPSEKKRELLRAVFSFRRAFDDNETPDSYPVLGRYGIKAGKQSDHFSGLAGSFAAVVYEITGLATADTQLKALWYLAFPYAVLLGAGIGAEVYADLRLELTDATVFQAVLDSPYSIYVRDSEEEMRAADIPSPVIEWYLPYLFFKNQKDARGVSREEKRFQQWLNAGRFAEVFTGTEKLLDSFPDDDGILICNIAARITLHSVAEESERHALLKETLSLIESALERGSDKKLFLLYYAGLTHLGLGSRDAALCNFIACTELNPNFNPALTMIRAMESGGQ